MGHGHRRPQGALLVRVRPGSAQAATANEWTNSPRRCRADKAPRNTFDKALIQKVAMRRGYNLADIFGAKLDLRLTALVREALDKSRHRPQHATSKAVQGGPEAILRVRELADSYR